MQALQRVPVGAERNGELLGLGGGLPFLPDDDRIHLFEAGRRGLPVGFVGDQRADILRQRARNGGHRARTPQQSRKATGEGGIRQLARRHQFGRGDVVLGARRPEIGVIKHGKCGDFLQGQGRSGLDQPAIRQPACERGWIAHQAGCSR